MSSVQTTLFDPVARWCSRGVQTCPAEATADVIAQLMNTRGVSSLIVEENGQAIGIVTDRDLRSKVVAKGLSPQNVTAREIMSAPVRMLPADAPIHQALLEMARGGIHRIVVADDAGQPIGVLTQGDLLRLQRQSPHLIALELETARTWEELRTWQKEINALIGTLFRSHVPIRELMQTIAFLNDALARRVAEITLNALGLDPQRVAFVVLGSQGRGEQTLATDQDNALILPDDASDEEIAAWAAYGERLSQGLLEVGFPPCPGNIMTRNPSWRRRLREWKEQIHRWVSVPTPEHVMYAAMFADARTLLGNDELTQEVIGYYYELAQREPLFLARMAQNTVRFAPPLGWFGRIKTQRLGEVAAGIDIKKAGIFALTDGTRLLAIQHRALAGNTFERLEALRDHAVLHPRDSSDFIAAFAFLSQLRLAFQLRQWENGQSPSNIIDVKGLSRLQRAELRAALQTVKRFQALLRLQFKLDLIRN